VPQTSFNPNPNPNPNPQHRGLPTCYAAETMDVPPSNAFGPLESARILLAVPTLDHIDGIFTSFASDAEVTKFLMWSPAKTREDSERAMRARLVRIESGEEFSWTLVLRETEKVFGNIALWPRSKRTEIGFAIARDYWGCGLAVEACRAVVNWVATNLGPTQLWGSCDPENLQSSRVLEKLGMIEVEAEGANKVRPNFSSEPRDSRIFELVVSDA
jgi:ribosomal-protein-alanine N-acetyltransferase